MTTAAACKKGHEWTEANTYVPPSDGIRRCRACRQDHRNHWHAAHPDHRGSKRREPERPTRGSIVASPAEAIKLLRAEGKDDDEIGRMLAQAKVPLPPGNYHHHTAITVRALMDEDESGFPRNGIARR